MSKDTHVSLDGRGASGRAPKGCVGPVCSIFSTAKSRNPGRGTTLRGQGRVHYWLVTQAGGDGYAVRGLFELGREYILARRTAKGRTLLAELLRVRTPFPGKDQYLFNEFGIALRKAGYPDGAVVCYRRALLYAEGDDHLQYNLARAYYEQGQWWDCMAGLTRCLELNPDLAAARDLAVLIRALSANPALRRRHGKPPVPLGVARSAAVLCETLRADDAAPARPAGDGERAAGTVLDQRRDTGLWLPGRDAVGL